MFFRNSKTKRPSHDWFQRWGGAEIVHAEERPDGGWSIIVEDTMVAIVGTKAEAERLANKLVTATRERAHHDDY